MPCMIVFLTARRPERMSLHSSPGWTWATWMPMSASSGLMESVKPAACHAMVSHLELSGQGHAAAGARLCRTTTGLFLGAGQRRKGPTCQGKLAGAVGRHITQGDAPPKGVHIHNHRLAAALLGSCQQGILKACTAHCTVRCH